MDLVDTIPHVRYWSKILRCSIPNPHLLTDLEVKATDLAGWLVVLRLNVPVNNFSVMSGRSHRFLGN